jgi:hypothetical protein
MNDFLEAVRASPLSIAMQSATWTVSTLQSIHIFTLAIVFTSAAAVDLRLLGVAAKDQPLERLTARFFPVIGWGLLLLATTGLLLMIAEPTRAILNLYFQLKMAALLVVGVGTWSLGRSVALNPQSWASPQKRALSKVFAVASLTLWALIIVAGRWIAYGP